tara:strand:- start:816 stop:941 length:126 start_codon:yes stop_codon:yes gene_type:complete
MSKKMKIAAVIRFNQSSAEGAATHAADLKLEPSLLTRKVGS